MYFSSSPAFPGHVGGSLEAMGPEAGKMQVRSSHLKEWKWDGKYPERLKRKVAR